MPKSLALCLLLLSFSFASAADHRVEALSQAAPADELSKEIAAQLAPSGFKVIRGTSRTVCEFWPCKSWRAKENFKPTVEVLYPFQVGQLIGVMRLPRKGSDFRDQDLASGAYTIRYVQQPIDGNHEGTSPTRDFLVLIRAEQDKSPEVLDGEKLMTASAEAAESNHPAMLCLQKPSDAKKLSIRHDEDHDWWIVSFQGKLQAGDKTTGQAMDLVVAGQSHE